MEEKTKKKVLMKILRFVGPVLIWALVIFMFSSFYSKPVSEIYWKEFVIKKSAHITEYFIFGLLIIRALTNFGVGKKKAGLIAILICFLYGLSDEFHQSFVPGRDARLRDVGFDTIGAYFAFYFIWKYLPKAPKKLKNLAKNWQLS